MLNITNYYKNANQNYNEVSMVIIKNIVQTINAGENVEKREPSHTVTGNINWYRQPLWKTVWRGLKKLEHRASI